MFAAGGLGDRTKVDLNSSTAFQQRPEHPVVHLADIALFLSVASCGTNVDLMSAYFVPLMPVADACRLASLK